MKPWDIQRVRADFPILERRVNGKALVYLDNAASSQKPRAVIESITRYYSEHHANVHRGVHTLSQEATDLFEGARAKVRAFIGASDDAEVIFTRGTTESINLVAQAWGRANVGPGDAVVVTRMEHHSNFVPWQALARERGAEFRIVELKPDLTLDWESFKAAMTGRPKILSMSLMSNALGAFNPVPECAGIAKKAGAAVLVDAAQAVAHAPLDVKALGPVDFVAFSGHKMCAPTGTGVLWGRKEVLEAMPPWQHGGDMIRKVGDRDTSWNDLPYKFEAGTPNIEGFVGLGAAVDYLNALGMDRIHAYETELAEALFARFARLEGVKLYNPSVAPGRRAPLVQFTVQGVHPHDLAQVLDSEGVAVRAGHHCVQPLLTTLGQFATARASFAFYNTFEEIELLAQAVERARRYFA